MGGMIADYYQSVMDRYHFIPDKNTGSFNPAGMYWRLSPEIGEGGYWVYAWKDLFDIKIHDFFFYQDIFMEFELPSCLSYTQYDSISGKELAPQRCLSAGCIKTFVSSRDPYKVLVHKEVPIRSVGIEIMPAYYEDYLKMRYPDSYDSPLPAFRKMDGADKFPEMARLLWQMKTYRGSGIAASLFYEGKIAEEESYDGLYAVCTDLLDDDVKDILKVSEGRWKIEECFRIMKTEFEARPTFVRLENRITAHFLICFLALLVYRLLELKLEGAYTCEEILSTLKRMNFADIEGQGYMPLYKRERITDALHEVCGFRTDYQFITKQKMKEIQKKSKGRE